MEIRIDNPCPANWDEMTGDNRSRFCGLCQLSVYNLSDMSDTEAQSFLRERTGQRTCVKFYRRPDGKIMTDNCPRALRKIRNAAVACSSRATAAVSLLLVLLLGTHAPASAQETGRLAVGDFEPLAAFKGKVVLPILPTPTTPTHFYGEAVIEPPPQSFTGGTAPIEQPTVSLSVRAHLVGGKTTPPPAVQPVTVQCSITPSETLRVQKAQAKMMMAKTLIAAGHLAEAERNYARAAALLSTIPGQTPLLREALENDIAMLRAMGKVEDARKATDGLAKLSNVTSVDDFR